MLPSWRRARKYAVLAGKGSMLETPSPVSGSTFGNYGLQLLIATKLLAVRFGWPFFRKHYKIMTET